MIDRRTFLAGAGAMLFAAPLGAEAQQTAKIVRIGLLSYAASGSASAARWTALRERLRELGTWRDRT